jgi:uncharacterized protein (TIGR03435 family)
MRRLLLGISLAAAVSIVTGAQAPPVALATQSAPSPAAFEVATLKQNKSGERGGGVRRQPGGRVTVTNMAARQLIVSYGLVPFQLSGGPSWLDNDKFDIVAKMEGNPEWTGPGSGTADPFRVAMQTLLADRFKLKLHKESREMDVYALVMVKPGTPGPALKPSTTDCMALAEQLRQGKQPQSLPADAQGAKAGPPPATGPVPCSIMGSPGMIRFDGFPMPQVAGMLVGQAGRIVIDRTGLTGNWQFVMTFSQERSQGLPPGPEADKIAEAAANPNAPSFFTALTED